ncbi:sigma-70 family RNA polymerase sigma factor [Nocardia sp. NPDC059240]|uniref:sigma-70 family RNA polymerase sigma factor n=1 Tax=Nocardia sp. NPDC059240 TaxID=3346786 RepID=UPI0036A9D8E2
MSDHDSDSATRHFERRRAWLTALAFRMLGASGEAEDAVQETCLRLSRTDPHSIRNLDGWLTTVLSRHCLEVLRARRARPEQPLGIVVPERLPYTPTIGGPEEQAMLGVDLERAVLVLLHRLHPAERVAFVLHDMFEVPFYEIAEILRRSPNAVRLLAGRARHRMIGETDGIQPDTLREQRIVRVFLASVLAGDLDAVLTLLAPDIGVSADGVAATGRTGVTITGPHQAARLAIGFAARAEFAAMVLVDGRPGVLVAAGDEAPAVMAFTIDGERITHIGLLAEPEILARLPLTIPDFTE